MTLEPWDWTTPRSKYPLLLHFHPLVIYRHQVLKQADTVLAMFLQWQDFTAEEKRRAFDFYDPITTGDSTLSACVQGIMAAEVGYGEAALDHFTHALFIDLDDTHGNTIDGVHIASTGGVWSSLVSGFAGLRDQGAVPYFDPRLPAEWDGLSFHLKIQGRLLQRRAGTGFDQPDRARGRTARGRRARGTAHGRRRHGPGPAGPGRGAGADDLPERTSDGVDPDRARGGLSAAVPGPFARTRTRPRCRPGLFGSHRCSRGRPPSGWASSSARIRAAIIATTAMTGHTVPATRKISPTGSTSAAGPARAMETGMRASETKKSRLETRPSRCGGTRRCSSVPQMTMPMPPVAPKMNRAAASGPEAVHECRRRRAAGCRRPSPPSSRVR